MKDLIIIGAGPIGLACGIEAKKNNLDYLIVDKGMLVNSIYNYPVNTTFFSTSDKLEIGEIPFISHNVKPTRTEALEYYYKQLKETSQVEVRQSINTLIEMQLKKKMMANVKEDYLLEVLDKPFVPEEKSSPVRTLIVLYGILAGFILSCLSSVNNLNTVSCSCLLTNRLCF